MNDAEPEVSLGTEASNNHWNGYRTTQIESAEAAKFDKITLYLAGGALTVPLGGCPPTGVIFLQFAWVFLTLGLLSAWLTQKVA